MRGRDYKKHDNYMLGEEPEAFVVENVWSRFCDYMCNIFCGGVSGALIGLFIIALLMPVCAIIIASLGPGGLAALSVGLATIGWFFAGAIIETLASLIGVAVIAGAIVLVSTLAGAIVGAMVEYIVGKEPEMTSVEAEVDIEKETHERVDKREEKKEVVGKPLASEPGCTPKLSELSMYYHPKATREDITESELRYTC